MYTLEKELKRQERAMRGVIRDQEKTMRKLMGYSKREPIPATKKNKVKERVKKKHGRIVCEQCGKKPRGVTLEFHHKNMKNTDNRLSNLQLLCPNHHRQKHTKSFRRVYRDRLTDRKYYSRLIKKKPKKSKKKRKRRKRRTTSPFEIRIPNIRI